MDTTEKAHLIAFVGDLSQILEDRPDIALILSCPDQKRSAIGVQPITAERIEKIREIILKL